MTMKLLPMLCVAAASVALVSAKSSAKETYRPVPPEEGGKAGKVLILSDDRFNDTELLYPLYRFLEEGYEVVVASPKGGTITGYNSAAVPDTKKLSELKPDPAEFAALYLPGGKAPASLRKEPEVLDTVKAFARAQKPIGVICHGPQILVSADLVRGRKLTSVDEVAKEITAAGGTWVDEAVVIDGNWISSRLPGDLPSQMKALLERLQKAQPREKAAAY